MRLSRKDDRMLRLLLAMRRRAPSPLWKVAWRARRGLIWTKRQMRVAAMADYLDYRCVNDAFLYSLSSLGRERMADLAQSKALGK